MGNDFNEDSKKVSKIVREGIKKHGDGRLPVPTKKMYPPKEPPPKKDKDK